MERPVGINRRPPGGIVTGGVFTEAVGGPAARPALRRPDDGGGPSPIRRRPGDGDGNFAVALGKP